MQTLSPFRLAQLVVTGMLFSISTFTASAATYSGNGGTGFGGPIGNSTLSVTSSTNSINFSLSPGTTFGGNDLVLYFDSVSGGFNSTSSFTDTSDPGRTAISGLSGNGRTLANFAPGFTADFALSIEPGSGAFLFNLQNTPSNFGFVSSANLSGSGTGPFTFSILKSDLGLPATGESFQFVGTLISTTAYRSNETIGSSVTVPGSPGDAPNAGFTGTTTFSNSNLYSTTAVPEPGTVASLAAGAGLLLAITKSRRTRRG